MKFSRDMQRKKREKRMQPHLTASKNCIIGISYTIERRKDVDFQPVFAIYTIKKEGKGLVSRRFLTTFASRTIK
jgi:hypothetical protein